MTDDKVVSSDTLHKHAARVAAPISPLAAAAATYDPDRDGPMTLDALLKSPRVQATASPGEPTLQPETVAGLAALRESLQEKVKAPPEEEEKKKELQLSDSEVDERLDAMSDLDMDMMLRQYRKDTINNTEQRKSVEARLAPMDLAAGLLSGEYRQVVPVKPGLTVTFRSTTPGEVECLRKIVLELQLADPRLANLSAERLTIMQMVASVVSFNGTEFPSHMTQNGHRRDFDEAVFLRKYEMFSSYPTPLVHALSTHAYWFDERVRKLFTMEAIKNS